MTCPRCDGSGREIVYQIGEGDVMADCPNCEAQMEQLSRIQAQKAVKA